MSGLLLAIFLIPMFLESCLGINWPKPTDTIKRKDTLKINIHTDCGGKMYIPDGSKNWGSGEFMYPVIEVADGVKISNCMVQGGDGIHCLGRCTIENCWVENVKDDAISFFGSNPNTVYKVTGGGVRNVKSKALQFNGAGTLYVTNYYMSNIIEGIRSCGNCKQQYRNREIHVDGLTVENLAYGQYVVGVNGNYGDKAYLKNIHVLRSKNIVVCRISEGNNGGTNPKIPQLTDDDVEYKQHCIYNKNDIYIGS